MRRGLAIIALAGASLCAVPAAALTLSSPDLAPGAVIAKAQINGRCGGGNLSPALAWSCVPPRARSLALTMIDIDVKPAQFSHWLVVDLPPTAGGLPRGVKSLSGKVKVLTGDFGEAAYAGPCPPAGSGTHHYQFTLWAMPTAETPIPDGASATEITRLLAGKALASATLTGVARR